MQLQNRLSRCWRNLQRYIIHTYIHTQHFKWMVFLADIDECALNQDNCNVNAECVNTPGSFQCVCREGYEGSGIICSGTSSYFHTLTLCVLTCFQFGPLQMWMSVPLGETIAR